MGSIYCQVCALDHGIRTQSAHIPLARGRIAQTLAAIERNIMARLQILEYPDPRLRTKAKPVEVFDAALTKVVEDMFETMYAAPGIGLAATQVDFHKRLIVMDVSEGRNEPRVFCNPEILSAEGAGVSEEGCLSVPGIFDEVKRAAKIRARAQDATGTTFEVELEGLTAVCLQHEMDHLEGKLFVDYLSDLKRERIRKKLEKDRKERANSTREATAARAY
jgi:peptide deformylase